MAGNGGNGLPWDPNGSQGTAGGSGVSPFAIASSAPGPFAATSSAPPPADRKLKDTSYYRMWLELLNTANKMFPGRVPAMLMANQNMTKIAEQLAATPEARSEFKDMMMPELQVATGAADGDPNIAYLAQKLAGWVSQQAAAAAPADALAAQLAAAKATGRQLLENQQRMQLLVGIPQQAMPPSATATPASQATDPPGSQGATGKPPRAPRAGTKRAAAEPADTDAPAPKAKRAKAPAAPRSRKKPAPGGDSDGAAPSAAEADDGDKLTLGGEVIDLVAETDAAVDVVERVRARTLASGAGARAWDEGFQFLSAWRLTNEALAQRREKMPGARGGSAAAAAEFVGPDVLRALQLGFAAHGAEVLRRAAAAATHRAASYAAPRRPEFAASGADARRGLGEIKRAAEKAADELAERKRQELMRAAASKRADDETRAAAQRAKAEMGVQMQADAANKALVATLGGRDAKWSKWGGGATTAGDDAKGKGKGKGKAGGAGAGTESGADGDAGGSRPRADTGGAAVGSAPPAPAAEGSTDVQIQDLVVALQQDPLYCKSTLLYRMMNGIL